MIYYIGYLLIGLAVHAWVIWTSESEDFSQVALGSLLKGLLWPSFLLWSLLQEKTYEAEETCTAVEPATQYCSCSACTIRAILKSQGLTSNHIKCENLGKASWAESESSTMPGECSSAQGGSVLSGVGLVGSTNDLHSGEFI